MQSKDAKILLSGIINNDDVMIRSVVDVYFEAAYKKALGEATRSIMESIGGCDCKAQAIEG